MDGIPSMDFLQILTTYLWMINIWNGLARCMKWLPMTFKTASKSSWIDVHFSQLRLQIRGNLNLWWPMLLLDNGSLTTLTQLYHSLHHLISSFVLETGDKVPVKDWNIAEPLWHGWFRKCWCSQYWELVQGKSMDLLVNKVLSQWLIL